MPSRRLDPRRVLLISAVAASALLSYPVALPADAAANGTSISAFKTTAAHLVSSHAWTLSKSASPSSLTLDAGQSADVSYTVGATRSPATLSAYVDGVVCVRNTGSVPTQGLAIVDKVSQPPKKNVIASAAVDVSGHPVLAPGESHCYPYRVDLPSGVEPGATYKDTATVSITNKSGKGSGPSPSATTTVPTTVGTVNNTTLTVADTNGSTFTFTSTSSVTYSQSFACPTDEGTHTNTVSAVGFVSGGGVSPPSSASATVAVTCPSPDLDLTKVADAASVDAGSPVGFTVTVANSGSGSATGVSVNDPLPAAPGVSWSIESQTGNACVINGVAPAAQTLVCTIGTLASGASYAVHVTSPSSFASCSSLPNTATLSATNAPTQTASASTTVVCSDLDLTKVADAASVDAGSPVGFTVTVSNGPGTGTATGVSVNDPLPAAAGVSWSIESQTGNACQITGAVGAQVLSCSIGSLASGASYAVHVTSPTSFASCSSLPNTATLSATNAPTLTASASTTVRCSDLSLTKTADTASVAAGSPAGFTVTAANSSAAGTGTATGVSLNDPLPAGLDWSIESQTGNACQITGAVGSEVLSCSIGSLSPGASYTVHFTAATAPENCGTLTNTATMNSTNAPTLTANASLTVTCSSDPDLDLTKVADAASVDAGSPVGFTVTVVNGAVAGMATGVSVNDPLPAASGVSWSIESQTGNACSVTGAVGSQVLSCSIGSLAAGASYAVHVTSPTSFASCSSLPNTATLTATNAPTLTASASTTVRCSDLDLTKTADAASVDAGSPVGFTVTASNAAGSGTATGVSVNDPLPAAAGVSWSIESQTGNACSITGAVGSQVLSCSIGSLAAGASYTVHVTSPTSFSSCSTLPNTATLNATNAPTLTANALTAVVCSDLTATKTADLGTVSAGSPVGFAVTVSNAVGSGTATGVSVNDPLPAGVDWSIESQTGNACQITGAVGSEVLSCSIGSLASGASYTVHFTAATGPEDCGILTNTATVSATNAPSLTASASLTITC